MGKRKQQLGDVPMDGTQPQDDESDDVSPGHTLRNQGDRLTHRRTLK